MARKLPRGVENSKKVRCNLCLVDVTGAQVRRHDATEEHQLRLRRYLNEERLMKAIRTVAPNYGCNKPPFELLGRAWLI